MTLGKIIYNLVFKPTMGIRYNLHHYGLSGWYNLFKEERSLKNAIVSLPSIVLSTDEVITFCFLTGAKYWHQTMLIIKSLDKHLPGGFKVKLYSDGTLTFDHIKKFTAFAPGICIIPTDQVDKYLKTALPKEQFPALNYLRQWHPFFRRLIDIHRYPGWTIHMDSDMLVLQRPDTLLDAFREKRAVYMQDIMTDSYFVDKEDVLAKKFNIHCARYVNGGIVAYNSDLVDYKDLEEKAQLLIDHYKTTGPARIEQTLMSYILNKQQAQPLDKDMYTIFYDKEIHLTEKQVIRHYIFKAKLPYLTTEWKKILL